MEAIFETNPVFLSSLLGDLKTGRIQLPDFQRGWVWEDERRGGLAIGGADALGRTTQAKQPSQEFTFLPFAPSLTVRLPTEPCAPCLAALDLPSPRHALAFHGPQAATSWLHRTLHPDPGGQAPRRTRLDSRDQT